MLTAEDLFTHYSGFSVSTMQAMEKLLRKSSDLDKPDTPDVRMSLDALRKAIEAKNANPLPL